MGAGIYRWTGLKESPHLVLSAVARRMPVEAAFSGWTAAWLHGLDVSPCDPIEVTIPEPSGSSRLAGTLVRRTCLSADDVVRRRGLPVTTPHRTVLDLAGTRSITEGVVAADMFLHAGLVDIDELRAHVAEHPGARCIARLRRVVKLAEPDAESPMETRLRMLLVLAGLPRPEVQVSIHDLSGRFVGRPDLLYRRQGVAIEFDGGNHRDRLVDDNRRQNGLIAMGLQMLRFTAADVYGAGSAVVMQVRHALADTTIRAQMAPNKGSDAANWAQVVGGLA